MLVINLRPQIIYPPLVKYIPEEWKQIYLHIVNLPSSTLKSALLWKCFQEWSAQSNGKAVIMENQGKLAIINELKMKTGLQIEEFCVGNEYIFKSVHEGVDVIGSYTHTDIRMRKIGAAKDFIGKCKTLNILSKL